jgi:hypothetical protein
MRIAGALGPEFAQGSTTEAGFTVGEVTLSGTLQLVVFVGIFSGLLGAVHYVVFRPWLGFSGPLRGLTFGLIMFAIGSATSDLLNPDNFDFAILGNSGLLVALVVVLFLLFGVVIDGLYRVMDRRVPPADQAGIGWKIGFGLVTLQGLPVAFGLLPLTLFTTESCSCDPPLVASIFVLVAALATILWLLSGWVASAARPATLLGYLGLSGALIFGLIRAISDSIEIIT